MVIFTPHDRHMWLNFRNICSSKNVREGRMSIQLKYKSLCIYSFLLGVYIVVFVGHGTWAKVVSKY